MCGSLVLLCQLVSPSSLRVDHPIISFYLFIYIFYGSYTVLSTTLEFTAEFVHISCMPNARADNAQYTPINTLSN